MSRPPVTARMLLRKYFDGDIMMYISPHRSAIFFILAMILIIRISTAQACGMSTHSEICTRAVHYFASESNPEYKQYLAENPDAAQAGSAFPDWGYAFGYPDESEAAHWAPFITAFAGYIHDSYPKPWDAETQRTAAFLLGIVAHSRADDSWHGSWGDAAGFINEMAQQEFHGDFGAAHDLADSGGDFLNIYERDMDWLAPSWYFPLDDIAAVYQLLGYTDVTPEILQPRTFMLFLGALGNKIAGRFIFPSRGKKSPLLVEQFQDYFASGLDAMAIRTILEWPIYIDYMENGAPLSLFDKFPDFLHTESADSSAVADWLLGWQLSQSGIVTVEIENTSRGVIYRAILPKTESEDADKSQLPASEPDVRFFSDAAYGYFGKSIAIGDFNGDKMMDLAIGAPGYGEPGRPQLGAVYIFYGRTSWDAAEMNVSSADLALVGSQPYGRFGWSLAAVDLNADGAADLAIAAPSLGPEPNSFIGKVFVYFGGDKQKGLSSAPDVVIDGVNSCTVLGHVLEAADANGDGYKDLLVGAPFAKAEGNQRGLAAIFYASADTQSGEQLAIDNADWLQQGEADYDWFGYSIGFYDRGANGRLLFVGAPGVDNGNIQETGKLYAYDLSGSDPHNTIFAILGDGEFDKTGAALAAGRFYGDDRDILALAAPSKTVGTSAQAGMVYFVDLAEPSGDVNINDLTILAALSGEQDFAHIGWRLAVGDVNADHVPDLLITEPWFNNKSGVMAGQSYLWLGSADFLSSANSFASAYQSVAGAQKQAMLGIAASLADLNGDGKDDIVLGAGRDSKNARHGGSAWLILSKETDDDTATDDDTVDDDLSNDDTSFDDDSAINPSADDDDNGEGCGC